MLSKQGDHVASDRMDTGTSPVGRYGDGRMRGVRDWLERRLALSLGGLLLLLVLVFLRAVLWPADGQALGGADVRGLFVPWLATAREAVRAGRLPLWDPYQFAGYPFLSNPQVGFFYPPTWLAWLLPVNIALSWHVALHIWLMGLGMLLLLRHLGAGWAGALLGAFTLAFSGFVSARLFAGHIGLLAVHAWLPWLLLAFSWAVRRRDIWSGLLAGLPFGLAILAGHTTSLLYVGLIWAGFALYLVSRGRAVVVLRQLLLAALMGLALSSVQLLPFLQFATGANRAATASYEFATDYSLPPAHLITLLLPEFFGEPTRSGYWSVPVFEELTYYAGLLPLLALWIALRKPRGLTWLFVGLMVLGLAIALGRYGFFYRLLYDSLPPFRLARAPGRAAFLYTFAAAALLGTTVTRWRQLAAEPADRSMLSELLRRTLTVAAVGSIAAIGVTGALFASQHPSDTSGRLWHQLGGWAWMVLLLLIGGALLWGYLTVEHKRTGLLAAGLSVLVLTDLWFFGFKMVRLEATAVTPLWSDARRLIGETEARVLPWGLSIFEQNGASRVGLRSVFGYNALEPADITALAGSIPDPRSSAYDLLAAEYVLAEVPLDDFTGGEAGLEPLAQEGSTHLYRRPKALPVVRLVSEVEVIPEREAAIARVHQPDFDAESVAILSQPPPCAPEAADSTAEARLLSHTSDEWRVATNSEEESILVVSEAAYPGWQVEVDGNRAAPLTVYTALRAVCVPAGEHLVTWHYRPSLFWIGGLITILALLLLAAAALIVRRSPAPTSDPDNYA